MGKIIKEIEQLVTTNSVGETVYKTKSEGKYHRAHRLRKLRILIIKLEMQYEQQIQTLRQLARSLEQENK